MRRISLITAAATAAMLGMSAGLSSAEAIQTSVGQLNTALGDSGGWSTPSGVKRRRGLTVAAAKRASIKRKNVARHRRHVQRPAKR